MTNNKLDQIVIKKKHQKFFFTHLLDKIDEGKSLDNLEIQDLRNLAKKFGVKSINGIKINKIGDHLMMIRRQRWINEEAE